MYKKYIISVTVISETERSKHGEIQIFRILGRFVSSDSRS